MNVPVSTKLGNMTPAEAATKCEELDEKNKEERKKFIDKKEKKKKKKGLNQEEQTALDKAKRGGMTFSSAAVSPGGGMSTQCSSGLVNSQITNAGPGGTSDQKQGLNKKTRKSKAKRHEAKKKKAGVLCNGDYVHPGGGKGAHGEAKIVNNMTNEVGGAMRGSTVVMNIDWRRNVEGGVSQSGMPCEDCYAMLCHAARECDIKIVLCNAKNEPTELSKENCDDDDGYRDLTKRVDGGSRPGR